MLFVDDLLPGAKRVALKRIEDGRGDFVKTYAQSLYAAEGLTSNFSEEYYSTSCKDVIRGMHFQTPPHDHVKIVYCAAGAVEDVLLDLRNGSGYGKWQSILLCAERPQLIVIPSGVAHGFRSLEDGSVMMYKTSTEYAPQCDAGIRWDSFGFDWRCEAPVMSDRDRRHPEFSEFQSPF